MHWIDLWFFLEIFRVNTLGTILGRGLRRRCPRCGQGRVFERWFLVVERCAQCGLGLRAREEDTWFFMYMSTAALTGVCILVMLATRPGNLPLARVLVAVGALFLFLVTHPFRKSLALAIDFYVDTREHAPDEL